MDYKYDKLMGRIAERCGSQFKFAKAVGISEHSISNKLNCKVGWKQQEIEKVCAVLDIPLEEIPEYFFDYSVQLD